LNRKEITTLAVPGSMPVVRTVLNDWKVQITSLLGRQQKKIKFKQDKEYLTCSFGEQKHMYNRAAWFHA
jgi:hypothetical protein